MEVFLWERAEWLKWWSIAELIYNTISTTFEIAEGKTHYPDYSCFQGYTVYIGFINDVIDKLNAKL